MPETTRTFVAIDLPDGHKADLRRLQEKLTAEAPDIRWVRPEQLHLTLAFLGDVPDPDIDAVCRAVGEAAAGFDPFELHLEALGAFPRASRPRVVWVGLAGEGIRHLEALQGAVVEALRAVGYPPAGNERFSPHVTLGRIKDSRGRPPDLSAATARLAGWKTAPFEVDQAIVYASKLGPGGASHSPQFRASLEGRKPTSRP
jgi:2'-5' RNA ligase